MIEVKVDNTALRKLLFDHNLNSQRFLREVGDELASEMKDRIQEYGEGRSRPGEPPASESGDLKRSLKSEIAPGKVLISGLAYAKILEDSSGLNRSFISPTLHHFKHKRLAKIAKHFFGRTR